MDLLKILLDQSNGGTMNQVGQQFGLQQNQTQDLLSQLVPALTQGMQRNTQQSGGLEALAGALSNGKHSQYLDDPGQLAASQTAEDGNAILGHIFGSKDVSRTVASRAAEKTGVDSNLIKKMLPVVASLVMGAMSKQTNAGQNLLGDAQGGAQTSGNLLTSLLDSDGDGSITDDLFGLAKKFF